MFLLPSAKVNGLILIILFLILFHHHISHFVSYDRLTPSFRQFALSLSSVSLPRSYEEVVLVPAWKQAMMRTWMLLFLKELGNWSLHLVYTLKYRPDDSVDRYKARLVA